MSRDHYGILAIWHDIAKESREDTLRWYDQQHHIERLSVPGFRSARRYSACSDTPELFIRYDTDSQEVLSSPAYLERVNNPTEWSKRAQRTIRNNTRAVFRKAWRSGDATGGHVLTLRLGQVSTRRLEDIRAVTAKIEELCAEENLLAAELWLADKAHTAIPSQEKLLRGAPDGTAAAAIILDSSRRSTLERIRAQKDRIEANFGPAEICLYQLCFAMSRS